MTWPVAPLGEVAETALGKMLDKGKPKGHAQVPYLRNINVQWGRIDTDDLLTMELAANERDRFGVREGDLLVCEGGEIGRCAIWHGRDDYLAYQKALHRIRPGDSVDARFLRYLLEHHSLSGTLAGMSTGTTIAHLPQQQLRRVPVPLPPLEEQQRIVELLEDYLSRLDAAQAGLTVAAQRAEQLRWSAAMAQVRKAGGTEVRLGDIADVRNGIFVSRASTEPDGIPILRIGAVRSLSLDLGDLRYSRRDESDLRAADALSLPGDLLFTRYNGNPQFVGACALVPPDAPTLTYPDKLIRVRLTEDDALPSFVALACSVGGARARIQAAVRTTAGQAGISGRDLKAVTLLLPDRDAQRSAVAAASDASVAARRLSDAISSGQHRKAALRRSLLAAAFSGQLTAETAIA